MQVEGGSRTAVLTCQGRALVARTMSALARVTRDESLATISDRLGLPRSRSASLTHAHLTVADR
jgi:hypothetical protein